MTKEEYLNIEKKYLDFCQFNECFYMPGHARWFNGVYQIAKFNSQSGSARIYYSCIVDNVGEIITGMKYIDVYEPSEFENAIKKFQKSYKEALVKQKMWAIEKDFKND